MVRIPAGAQCEWCWARATTLIKTPAKTKTVGVGPSHGQAVHTPPSSTHRQYTGGSEFFFLIKKYGKTVSAAAGWAAPQPKGMLACLRHLGSAELAAAQIHGGCAPTKTLNPQQCDTQSTNTRKQQTAIWSSDTWRAWVLASWHAVWLVWKALAKSLPILQAGT